MKHTRLDDELIVTGAADAASAVIDLLNKDALDNITLWVKDASGTGGSFTIQKSDDAGTWEDDATVTIAADDVTAHALRPPYARYVRLKTGATGVTLAVGS